LRSQRPATCDACNVQRTSPVRNVAGRRRHSNATQGRDIRGSDIPCTGCDAQSPPVSRRTAPQPTERRRMSRKTLLDRCLRRLPRLRPASPSRSIPSTVSADARPSCNVCGLLVAALNPYLQLRLERRACASPVCRVQHDDDLSSCHVAAGEAFSGSFISCVKMRRTRCRRHCRRISRKTRRATTLSDSIDRSFFY
jgi:hypothetical protein